MEDEDGEDYDCYEDEGESDYESDYGEQDGRNEDCGYFGYAGLTED
jgi:hypothetical protein